MTWVPVKVPKPGGKRAPKGLKRSRMKRGKRIKTVNRKRGGHAFPKNVDEARRDYIRSLPCLLTGRGRPAPDGDGHPQRYHHCTSPTRCCHLKSRGSGGKDAGNMWPGCDAAHEEQHRRGISGFEERWGVNLAHECARHEGFWLWLTRFDGGPLRAGTP